MESKYNLKEYLLFLCAKKGEKMNVCYLVGKIVTEPKYDFFYNSKKHISIIQFDLENQYEKNITKVKVKAYDEEADYIYQFFSKGDWVNILGWLNQKMEITIEEIERWKLE